MSEIEEEYLDEANNYYDISNSNPVGFCGKTNELYDVMCDEMDWSVTSIKIHVPPAPPENELYKGKFYGLNVWEILMNFTRPIYPDREPQMLTFLRKRNESDNHNNNGDNHSDDGDNSFIEFIYGDEFKLGQRFLYSSIKSNIFKRIFECESFKNTQIIIENQSKLNYLKSLYSSPVKECNNLKLTCFGNTSKKFHYMNVVGMLELNCYNNNLPLFLLTSTQGCTELDKCTLKAIDLTYIFSISSKKEDDANDNKTDENFVLNCHFSLPLKQKSEKIWYYDESCILTITIN